MSKIKGQFLHNVNTSHLMMYSVGTGSSMLHSQMSHMLHLLKANMKHIRQVILKYYGHLWPLTDNLLYIN